MKKAKRFLAVLLAASLFMGSTNCGVLAADGADIISESEISDGAELSDTEEALTENTETEDAEPENVCAEEAVTESGDGTQAQEDVSETEAASEALTDEENATSDTIEVMTDEIVETANTVEASALKIYTDHLTYINPLYEDVIDESDLVQPAESADADVSATTTTVEYLTSISEAAAIWREGMENRQATIVFGYMNQTGYDEDLADEIFEEALEHTGVSTQGDYLKWNYDGWHASISYYPLSGWYYFTYTFTMTYKTTAAQEAELTAALEEVEASLNLDSLSDYGKVRAIYDYICANVVYDYTNLNDGTYMLKYTAYAALINGTSVCQGYATLFYRMALDAGLDARFISGIGSGGNHGWNIVKVGDYYYNLDSTWDAPYYVAGYDYRYFLRCDANFGDHTRDSAYSTDEFYAAYPMGTVDFDPETMDVTDTDSGPVITVQPQSVVVANAGDKATLTVEAEGNDLSYSWYYRNPGTSSFKATGTTTSSITVSVTAARDGREMYCVITDANGNSVTTDTVTLSIEEKEVTITIITQPQSVAVANAGDKATLTVEAEGEDLSYSWYYKNPGSSTFKATGTTTSSITVSVTAARDGRQMYCLITDANGNSVTTDTVTLSIAEAESTITIITQPQSVAVANAGDKATLTVEAEGEGLTYSWYYKNPGSSTFKATGTTTASVTVSVTAARDGRQMYCLITDANGNSVATDTVTLSIAEAESTITIITQPQSVAVASAGDKVTLTVEAEGEGLTYSWYYKNPGSSTFKASGTTTASVTAAVTAARDGRQMYCLITDANGNSVTTDTVTLSIQ